MKFRQKSAPRGGRCVGTSGRFEPVAAERKLTLGSGTADPNHPIVASELGRTTSQVTTRAGGSPLSDVRKRENPPSLWDTTTRVVASARERYSYGMILRRSLMEGQMAARGRGQRWPSLNRGRNVKVRLHGATTTTARNIVVGAGILKKGTHYNKIITITIFKLKLARPFLHSH